MWARIDRGAVAELTGADPMGRYHPSLEWVEAGPDVVPGMTYQDGTFSDPPPPPVDTSPREVGKQELIERIQAAGKLRAVRAALGFGADDRDLNDDELFLRERWEAAASLRSDDAPVRQALAAAGCDVDALLGPAP